jgi:hypothetical protein
MSSRVPGQSPDMAARRSAGPAGGLIAFLLWHSKIAMSRSALRPLAVALALVPLGFSGFAFLGSLLWGLGLRCDDSCGGGDWRRTEDAWQWNVLPVLGSLALICGLALVVCVWRGWVTGALASLVVGTSRFWPPGPGSSPDGMTMSIAIRKASCSACSSSRQVCAPS